MIEWQHEPDELGKREHETSSAYTRGRVRERRGWDQGCTFCMTTEKKSLCDIEFAAVIIAVRW